MKEKESIKGNTIKHHYTKDSLSGIDDLNPITLSRQSLNGIAELKPQVTPQTGQDSSQEVNQNDAASQDIANTPGSDKSNDKTSS
jgi:hypothetical protein